MNTSRLLFQVTVFLGCFSLLPFNIYASEKDQNVSQDETVDLNNPTVALNTLVRQVSGLITSRLGATGSFLPLGAIMNDEGAVSLLQTEDTGLEHVEILREYHRLLKNTARTNPKVIATVLVWPDAFKLPGAEESTLSIQMDADHRELEPKLILIPYYIDKEANKVVIRAKHTEYAKGLMAVFPSKISEKSARK